MAPPHKRRFSTHEVFPLPSQPGSRRPSLTLRFYLAWLFAHRQTSCTCGLASKSKHSPAASLYRRDRHFGVCYGSFLSSSRFFDLSSRHTFVSSSALQSLQKTFYTSPSSVVPVRESPQQIIMKSHVLAIHKKNAPVSQILSLSTGCLWATLKKLRKDASLQSYGLISLLPRRNEFEISNLIKYPLES